MYRDHKIGLLLPAYNEAENIADVLKRLPEYLDFILVVDDGSVDQTAAIAADLGAKVISHKSNRGVGATFQTGVVAMRNADVDIMVNMDSDGQFNSGDIVKLIDPIVDGKADFVTASRFMDKDLIPEMSGIKKWGNFRMARLISWLIGQKFYDVSCGFRAYNREVLFRLNLFGSFTYTQESFIDLAFKGVTIKEVPAAVRGRREKGKSRVASNLFRYTYQTVNIILKTFRDHKPLKLFGFVGMLFFIPGLLGLIYLFYFRLQTGAFTPYKWIGFVCGSLIMIAVISYILGFILDMFSRMRHNQEEMLFQLKMRNSRNDL
jgi:glycosyltransferase involved in cell wall biosynthesis